MAFFRALENAPASLADQGSVIIIGNFDGVHRGHQKLISQACAQANKNNLAVCAITFEPNPVKFFSKRMGNKANIFQVQKLSDKIECLAPLVDHVFCLPFNDALANLRASDFLDKLTYHLGAKCFCVGEDFRIGRNREGDLQCLKSYALVHNQEAKVLGALFDDFGERISSTLIRAKLREGDLPCASRLLGRNYAISGKVGYGLKLGRQWGFPTANIALSRSQLPLEGIFAVKVVAIDNKMTDLYGVASIGTNPTIGDNIAKKLEVHLFDFNQDLYGKRLKVEFIEKMRDEEKFTDIETLVRAIHIDVAQAKAILLLE